jgi:flagellar FliL protein
VAEVTHTSTPARSRAKAGVVIVTILVLAGATAGYWSCRTRAAEASPAGSGQNIASVLHLDTFVLNLADPDQRAYLRIGIDLGLDRQLKKPAPGESGPPIALVRDTILSILSENRPEDLTLAEGKTKLKERLLKALQERAPELGVREIYFTEFLIQR